MIFRRDVNQFTKVIIKKGHKFKGKKLIFKALVNFHKKNGFHAQNKFSAGCRRIMPFLYTKKFNSTFTYSLYLPNIKRTKIGYQLLAKLCLSDKKSNGYLCKFSEGFFFASDAGSGFAVKNKFTMYPNNNLK